MANLLATSKDTKALIRANFDLISLMTNMIDSKNQQGQKISKEIGKNFVWVAYQMSLEGRNLTLKEVEGTAKVFYEFIITF